MTQMRRLLTRRGLVRAMLILVAGAALFALPSMSLAQPAEEEPEPQPQPAYRFYGFTGSVTIDDEPAPHGTVIEAWANGEVVGTGQVRYGAWNVDVDYHLSGITFTVNDLPDTGGSYDALMRGGQARITLAVISQDESEEVGVMQDECPEADAMESDDSMSNGGDEAADSEEDAMTSDCPEDEGDDSLLAEDEAGDDELVPDEEEEVTDAEEDVEGFPDGGSGGLNDPSMTTAVAAAMVLGGVALAAALMGIARRRAKPSARV